VEAVLDGGVLRAWTGLLPALTAGGHWLTLRRRAASGEVSASRWVRIEAEARAAAEGPRPSWEISLAARSLSDLPGVSLVVVSGPAAPGETLTAEKGTLVHFTGDGITGIACNLGGSRVLGPTREGTLRLMNPGERVLHVEGGLPGGGVVSADWKLVVSGEGR
jgi:hypothetical protein